MTLEVTRRPDRLIGRDAASRLVSRTCDDFRIVHFVVDAAVIERTRALVPELTSSSVTVVGLPVDVEAADALGRTVRGEDSVCLIAIGGGNVIDLVKLSAVEATNPRLLQAISARAPRHGYLGQPRLPAPPLPFVVVPTTIGTGSEANASACFQVTGADSARKSLVSLQPAAASAVAYDPAFTAGPHGLLRSGLFEIAARVVGATVGSPSSCPQAEREAERILAGLSNLEAHTRRRFSGEARIAGAVLSGDSHAGPALRGRGIAPSPLWILATEVSMAAGVSKNDAALALVTTWLTSVANGDDRWGSRRAYDRLGRFVDAEDLVAWFRGYQRDGAPVDIADTIDVETIAHRVKERFGIGSLAGLSAADIAELIVSARTDTHA